MRISLSKEVETYNKKQIAGFDTTQVIFGGIVIAVGSSIFIFLNLFFHLPELVCVYVAMPVVVPIGLCGFYKKNNMYFYQIVKQKKILKKISVLLYCSTEEVKNFVSVEKNEAESPQKMDELMKKVKIAAILGGIGFIAIIAIILWMKIGGH